MHALPAPCPASHKLLFLNTVVRKGRCVSRGVFYIGLCTTSGPPMKPAHITWGGGWLRQWGSTYTTDFVEMVQSSCQLAGILPASI